MAPLSLFCAVYGDGSIFPIKIDRKETVYALQETVVEVKFPGVDPSEVTLFLARAKETGEWLKDDGPLRQFLRGGISAAYQKMRPTLLLSRNTYFGKTNEFPANGVIHVLVKLPAAMGGRSNWYEDDSSMWRVRGSIPKVRGVGWYDGIACDIPIVNIRPSTVEARGVGGQQ